MKILHISKGYYPDIHGGIENFIETLTMGAFKKGIENIIAVPSPRGFSEKDLGYAQIKYFPLNFTKASCPFSFPLLKAFKELASEVDMIHYHYPWPFMDIMHLFNAIKTPSILTYHSDIVKQKYLKLPYLPLMHAFLNRVDSIVATSENYIKTSQDLKRHLHKTSVIPLGIQDPINQVNKTRKAYWQSKFGKNFIFFVGVLRYYKGVHVLIEALKNFDLPLVIAGVGPCEKVLKAQVTEMGLKNVHFLGRISDEDKFALMDASRTFVLPSIYRSEAFGIVLIEALALGKPSISTELGTGTSFVNQEGESGLVVNPNDVRGLSNAIIQLNEDERLYQQLAKGARSRYLENFTADQMVERYIKVWAKLRGDE